MKKRLLVAILATFVVHVSSAGNAEFDGLAKAMDPATYERAGLNKLTSEQRAVLDDFVRKFVGAKEKDAAALAAAQAVDRAVKERKVRPPEVIESRIVGSYTGYGPRTFFHLANGQTWKPTNDDVVGVSAVEDPSVVLYRDTFGYKMFISGAGTVRVKRIR